MRIALGIEYDGAAYSGWQRQKDANSIQAEIERALSKIANHPVEVQCAGRTDAGVHATAQVVHFDTHSNRELKAWMLGMNTLLPDTIAVRWAQPVSNEFHARYSAHARRYRYVIHNHRLRSGILNRGVTHFYHPLDAQRMHQAAQALVGEHDFSAFRASHCQSRTPYRNVQQVKVYRRGDYVIIDIRANAFLHHMVRNITGSLLQIGCNEQEVDWIARLLADKDRTLAAATAKPHGLYLVEVSYPGHFGLPTSLPGPLFLQGEPLAD